MNTDTTAVKLTNVGNLKIITKPFFAEVIVDGKIVGKTPLNVILEQGKHTVLVRKRDYHNEEFIVQLSVGENRIIEIDLKRHTTTLDIISNPLSAEVILDGGLIGMTPLRISDVPVGVHSFEIQKQGYYTRKETVNIKLNKIEYNLVSFESIDQKIKDYKTGTRLCLSSAAISFTVGGFLKYLSYKHYEEYQRATKKATDLHKTIELEETFSSYMFGIGAIGMVQALLYYCEGLAFKKQWDLSVIPANDGVMAAVRVEW